MEKTGATAKKDSGGEALHCVTEMEDRQMDLSDMLRRRLDWTDDTDPVGLDLFKALSGGQRKKAKAFMVDLLRQEAGAAYTEQGGTFRSAVG